MARANTAFDEAARALRALDVEFERAASAGDTERLVDLFYTDDAQVLPAHQPPICGRAAILAFWEGAKSAGMKKVTLNTTRIEVGGGLACGIGEYTLTLEPQPGQAVTDVGKYVVVYRRQPDGKWKAIVDMASSNR